MEEDKAVQLTQVGGPQDGHWLVEGQLVTSLIPCINVINSEFILPHRSVRLFTSLT